MYHAVLFRKPEAISLLPHPSSSGAAAKTSLAFLGNAI
jgi:hypothetical protein